jgi:hypothetical protein
VEKVPRSGKNLNDKVLALSYDALDAAICQENYALAKSPAWLVRTLLASGSCAGSPVTCCPPSRQPFEDFASTIKESDDRWLHSDTHLFVIYRDRAGTNSVVPVPSICRGIPGPS